MNTDKFREAELKRVSADLRKEYKRAYKETSNKLLAHLKAFEAKDAKKRAMFEAGEITKQEYAYWRTGQIMTGKRWKALLDELSMNVTNANIKAAAIIDGKTVGMYTAGMNLMTYNIEKAAKVSTSFTLYNEAAVNRLLRGNPKLLPKPKVNIAKDKRWNQKRITSEIMQGILQGEGIPDIALRMLNVTNSSANAAMRNARTIMTGAMNAGVQDSMERADELGIHTKKVWIATLDNVTRDSHALLDGEEVDPDEKFSNGCEYPGDPDGEPEEVYNCRCTMGYHVASVDMNLSDMTIRDDRLGGMSYEDWKQMHAENIEAREERRKVG